MIFLPFIKLLYALVAQLVLCSCLETLVILQLFVDLCYHRAAREHKFERRYGLCTARHQHTATQKRQSCRYEVMDILGCWLSLVFLKALKYFFLGGWEMLKKAMQMVKKSKPNLRKGLIWEFQMFSIPFQNTLTRRFQKAGNQPKTFPWNQGGSHFSKAFQWNLLATS